MITSRLIFHNKYKVTSLNKQDLKDECSIETDILIPFVKCFSSFLSFIQTCN